MAARNDTVHSQVAAPLDEAAPLDQAASLQAYASRLDALSEDSDRLRSSLKSSITSALAPLEQRRARRLERSAAPLRLHLGCADNYLGGWLNIDLARPGRRLDLRWDLRRPVPFSEGSVEAIFAEHLLEHLTVGQGLGIVQECRRLLRPGGVLRIGVPDLERYIGSYRGTDSLLAEVRPGRPTVALAFCEVFYRYGHRSMYDFDTLQAMCVEAGFGEVHRCQFGKGRIQPCPDSQARRPETLYVEAVV